MALSGARNISNFKPNTMTTTVDQNSVGLRPKRSPKWPNTTDPSGRAMKARPKVAKEWSKATVGLSVSAKKRCGNTATAAVA